MSSKLKRLGGLADVYQSEKLDGAITRLKIDKIRPSADQPRQERTIGIDELASSIERDGLLSPLVVTKEGDGYRIIAGERRYHALKKLNHQDIECRIISRQERDYYRIAIIENLQRENLNPVEEAAALRRLKAQENYSDEELAKIVGKSRNYITETLGITTLPPEVVDECKKAGLDNKNLLIQVVQAYKKGAWKEFLEAYRHGEITTVRSAKEYNQQGPAPKAPRERKERGGEGNYQLTRKKNRIEIVCDTEATARQLAAWIQKFNGRNGSGPTEKG